MVAKLGLCTDKEEVKDFDEAEKLYKQIKNG